MAVVMYAQQHDMGVTSQSATTCVHHVTVAPVFVRSTNLPFLCCDKPRIACYTPHL